MRQEVPFTASYDFGSTPVEEIKISFRPVPAIREAADALAGPIAVGIFRGLNHYDSKDPNVFLYNERIFGIGLSRASAIPNRGFHLVLSGDEQIHTDPSPREIATLVSAIAPSFDRGAYRLEINFGEYRNRPHFHIHIIRCESFGPTPIKAPLGEILHKTDCEKLAFDNGIKIEKMHLYPESTGTIFKAVLGLLPHPAEMLDKCIPGQSAPSSRLIASKIEEDSLVIARIEGPGLPRSIDPWVTS